MTPFMMSQMERTWPTCSSTLVKRKFISNCNFVSLRVTLGDAVVPGHSFSLSHVWCSHVSPLAVTSWWPVTNWFVSVLLYSSCFHSFPAPVFFSSSFHCDVMCCDVMCLHLTHLSHRDWPPPRITGSTCLCQSCWLQRLKGIFKLHATL